MNLIYLFLISPRYYKPANSVKYNPILLLLLLSLCKNNNNCNGTRFSSSKVKNDTSTADKNYKTYSEDNTINNYNSNTNYNNGCYSDTINTKYYINRKFNHKKSTFKSTNKLTTTPECINKDNLIDSNNTLFKSYDSSNTSDAIIDENINNTKDIEHNININNLVYYSDELFKSFDPLDTNSNIANENIDNITDANNNINNLNLDCICDTDIADTKAYVNKEINSENLSLKSSNKLATASEDINTRDLIDFDDKSFDSLNTINSNTENIEDNNINHNTDNFVSNCQRNLTNKSNLNKITSTIKHIDNSTHINSCYLSNKANYDNFNISEDINRTFKLPTLLIKCDISDSFKGDINFCNYISSINDIKNKLVITSNLLLLDVTKRDKGTLFLDGYLETDIDYSTPLELKVPLICKHSNFVLRSPLNISVPIDLQYTVPGEENAFSDLDLSLVKSSFNIKNDLCENLSLEDYVSVYKGCKLIIIANYYIEAFKNEVFHY